jgi:hypothetical protein
MKRALAGALVLLVLAPAAGWAHVRSTAGYAEVRQDGSAVHYGLSLERDLLAAAAGDDLEGYLVPRVQVLLDGVACEGALVGTSPERREGRAYTRALLEYECAGSPTGAFELRYGVFTDGDAVVDDHTAITDYRLGGHAGTFVFDAGHRELDVGETGPLSSAGRFVALGIDHILAGVDHVLFLAALLLGARTFVSVLKLATAFTAAHSVTLALAATGLVEVPAEVVEPLIALSIAYVAADILVGGSTRQRLPVVFAFGLLHGLGFASTLNFTDELGGRLLASLASFNIGIELGQALIIAALFPLLVLVRRFRWSPAAHAAAAAVAAGFGLLWFFERLAA